VVTYDVNYEALQEVGTTLGRLKDEFGGAEDRVDGYGGQVGHEDVADALHDFATNWSDDRGEIVEKMENVASFAKQASAAYHEYDHGLAGEISKDG
jgi:hypothetical protein